MTISTWMRGGAAALSLCGMSAQALEGAELSSFDMQRCVNIGNSLEAPRDGSWGGTLLLSEFALIREAGFDTVRVPVRWHEYSADGPGYRLDDAIIQVVRQVVDAALEQHLNVILNVHHFHPLMEDPAAERERLMQIWRQVGVAFADYPEDDVWFEVLNEPSHNLHGDIMRDVLAEAVGHIREANPTRILILGGEDWSGIRTLESNIAPPDENIVYTFHYYDPFDFTHQFATWVDPVPSVRRGWGDEQDRAQLAVDVNTATEFRTKMSRPLFLGEFGVHDPVEPEERVKWVGAVRQAMEAENVPWCLWAFANTFSIYDRENDEWDEPMLEALGLSVPAPRNSE